MTMRLKPIALLLLLVVFETLAWIRLSPATRSPQNYRAFHRIPAPLSASRGIEEQKLDLKLLLIDHYDSFTYNLADLLSQLCTTPPLVVAADCAASWEEFLQSEAYRSRNWTGIDGVVISPGPGTPQTAGTLSRDVILKNPDLPILGVCLGHQILGHVYGAQVGLAPEPIHGQVRKVRVVDSSDPVWRGMGESIEATRYHSLHVTDLKESTGLIATALSADDSEELVMAMRHRKNPHFGVQFHPESIGTPRGKELLSNFCEVVNREVAAGLTTTASIEVVNDAATRPRTVGTENESVSRNQVFIHKISGESTRIRPEEVMKDMLSDSDFSFWLDGDQAPTAAERTTDSPAVSILGNSTQRIEYWGKEKPASKQGLYRWMNHEDSPCERFPEMDVLTYLEQQYRVPITEATMVSFDETGSFELETKGEDELLESLPFSFRGGHVGFLGYEVRHDTARFLEEQERGRHHLSVDASKCHSNPHVPTAAFLVADRSFVYDQRSGDWYLVGVSSLDTPHSKDETLEWMMEAAEALYNWAPHADNGLFKDSASSGASSDSANHAATNGAPNGVANGLANGNASNAANGASEEREGNGRLARVPPTIRSNRSRKTYNDNFDQCIEHIRQGNSYELCLTNQFEADARVPGSSPLDLYSILRRRNPAPFSAFLNWNSAQRTQTGTDGSFSICCSSPERFVSVRRKNTPLKFPAANGDASKSFELQVEAKPIKGTCARVQPHPGQSRETLTDAQRAEDEGRARDLQASVKNASKSFELQVEAKPIKGTCARVQPRPGQSRETLTDAQRTEDEGRARDLQASVKNRAENLMIVDLLRSDLSRVCKPGTVHVAKLMDIESFATVHQMVSTIRGTLEPDKASALDILKACFPGGSMTGAPKLRTMEILDDLEGGVCRGPYSGSLGYISLNGSMDMSIVIRTAVLTPLGKCGDDWKVSIGAGGAITALSESTDEYDEMILKSSAVVQAVQEWATMSPRRESSEYQESSVTNDQAAEAIRKQLC
jgi:para-aminobenzoate synthetase